MRNAAAVMLALWSAAAWAAASAVDSAGRRVSLPAPAQRIVSLAPHVTELLYAAGAGSRVVGTVAFSNYPEEAKGLPQVGSALAIDIERIAALKPDLVVVWQHGNSPRQLDALKGLG